MKRKAFTLIELLVVIVIMIILIGITLPVIKSLTRDNSQKQAVNLVTTMLSNARAIAISERRQAGVIFFEETPAFSSPVNTNQTVIQLIVEDRNQSQYAHGADNTVFVYHSLMRQYCPTGIMVAAFNDDVNKEMMTGTGGGGQSRVVLFDSNGQMIWRNGISRPDLGSGAPGSYPKAYGDWKVATKAGNPANGVSTPAVVVFSKTEYTNFLNNGTPTDKEKSDWIEQHADVLVVNAYTGGLLR